MAADPPPGDAYWRATVHFVTQGIVPYNNVPRMTQKSDEIDTIFELSRRWKEVKTYAWIPIETAQCDSVAGAKRNILPHLEQAVQDLADGVARTKKLPFGPEDVKACWQEVIDAWLAVDYTEEELWAEWKRLRPELFEPKSAREPEVEYYFYFKTKKSAVEAGKELSAKGWSHSIDRSAASDTEWLMLVKGKGASPDEREAAELTAILEPFGGDYDGWQSD